MQCFHCGAEIPAAARIEIVDGDQATLNFCCHGCHGAYLLITGAGLSDFYRRRRAESAGEISGASPAEVPFSDDYLASFVRSDRQENSIDIIIDGIRCASCVWLLEKMIARKAGVREARVNFATGRARVAYDATAVSPSTIFSTIAEIGYSPRPYSQTAAAEAASQEQRDLLFRFGTAFFLTMQLMAYSFALYAGYLQGIDTSTKRYLQLFSLLVTTPVIFYCGRPFLAGAWRSARNHAPSMELLIAVGALSSYGFSVYALFTGGEVYFETAAMIVTLILAGRLLENAAKRRACSGVERLLGLCPPKAHRIRNEVVETVEPAELRPGDLVLVAPGDRFPADGRIMEGTSDVDESAATGEPLPVVKSVGDGVHAGCCNLTGAVRVLCEKGAADSFVARVARLVEEAQSRRAPIQGVADRVSALFVPAVIALSFATFAYQLIVGIATGQALMTALSVLVIACPCALGLATPTAVVAGTGGAARRGVIFKGGDVLERLSRVDVAVFDKTGTLTCGRPEVLRTVPTAGVTLEMMLAMAASVESGSRHPIGRAILEEAAARGVGYEIGSDLKTHPGGGVTGRVRAGISGDASLTLALSRLRAEAPYGAQARGERGLSDEAGGRAPCGAQALEKRGLSEEIGLETPSHEVAVGNERLLRSIGVSGMPEGLGEGEEGMVVCVALGGQYCGHFLLRDRLRDDAPPLASYFRDTGIQTLLLSGDRHTAAQAAAAAVGIGEAAGELSPADKATRIEKLRAEGATVLMVGDGINDAPALSAADVGCAVAGGTDIAIETSELVLVKADLERLVFAHRIARRTMSIVRQNLAWAFIYNAIGIPLAMTGRLTPIFAAAAMAVSSLCVVGNSLRLTKQPHTLRPPNGGRSGGGSTVQKPGAPCYWTPESPPP